MDSPSYHGDALAFATELAAEAAARAKRMAAEGFRIDTKHDGSVVTDIDRTVETFLREAIRAKFPEHGIVGEEYGQDGLRAGAPFWALDPIDGTTNLANGLPFWGVSIALIDGDAPVVGVVAAPLMDETFAGATGLGATFNGVSLPPLPTGGALDWEDTYGICSTAARERDFSRLSARLRIFGSAALDLCYVAVGRLRGCQSTGCSLYDIAAGLCIATEVGTQTAWLSGKPWSARALGETGSCSDDVILTAPPATLDWILSRIV